MPSPRPPHNGSSVVSYLEQQLLASKALGSQQEYIHWFMALITFLLTQGKNKFISSRGVLIFRTYKLFGSNQSTQS